MVEESSPNRVVIGIQEIWIDDQGILRTEVQADMHVTLEDAQAHLEAGLELTKGEKYPVLADLRKIKSMERSARAFYAGSHTTRLETAVAILVDSPVNRVIGNFFIGLNRSSVPTRLFTCETEALEWLKEYRT